MTVMLAKEDVWELADAAKSEAARESWSASDWLDAERLLDDHKIELFERPSAQPGVYGNPGASPKQLQIQQTFFARKHRVIAASGGNQSGKTQAIGGMCFCKWIRDKAQDGDVYWVIAQTHETMRDIPQKTLWNFLPRSMFPEGLAYSPKLGFGMISTLHLTLPDNRGKCEVWFRTEESDLLVFESARANGVWWTECSRESVFDALQPRLAARGGFLLMDYVPRESWHRMRIQTGANPYITHTRFAMFDNAHNLPEGEIEYQRAAMTPEEAAVRIDGKDGAAFGVVIKEFSANPYDQGGHVVPNRLIPADWPAWVYIDVGKYTAALLLTIGEDGNKYVADEVYTLGLNVSENAKLIIEMLQRNGRTLEQVGTPKMDPAAWSFSAANQVTVADQYRAAGIAVAGWVRTASIGEEAMLQKMRVAFMHRNLLVYARCEKTIMELQTWRHKTDRDGKVDPADRYQGPNHTIDALKAWVAEDPVFTQPSLMPIFNETF